LQNSPLESSCVVVALTENYSTSKPLNVSPEKSHILSCDTVVANGRYIMELFSVQMQPNPLNNSHHMQTNTFVNVSLLNLHKISMAELQHIFIHDTTWLSAFKMTFSTTDVLLPMMARHV
jgi:hypothetical protein